MSNSEEDRRGFSRSLGTPTKYPKYQRPHATCALTVPTSLPPIGMLPSRPRASTEGAYFGGQRSKYLSGIIRRDTEDYLQQQREERERQQYFAKMRGEIQADNQRQGLDDIPDYMYRMPSNQDPRLSYGAEVMGSRLSQKNRRAIELLKRDQIARNRNRIIQRANREWRERRPDGLSGRFSSLSLASQELGDYQRRELQPQDWDYQRADPVRAHSMRRSMSGEDLSQGRPRSLSRGQKPVVTPRNLPLTLGVWTARRVRSETDLSRMTRASEPAPVRRVESEPVLSGQQMQTYEDIYGRERVTPKMRRRMVPHSPLKLNAKNQQVVNQYRNPNRNAPTRRVRRLSVSERARIAPVDDHRPGGMFHIGPIPEKPKSWRDRCRIS